MDMHINSKVHLALNYPGTFDLLAKAVKPILGPGKIPAIPPNPKESRS